ncbi:unnamed protein product [Dimorphilus gyrociliatus]|uniref:Uncharacterized protein n=1 Tax=Dimorphilus gyrociliatus TaxID=2664684 RepID=A0A7I8WFH4_9ANNE|nr:unnamed protein product [Dimorphilus gyrociliatus]
MVRLRSKLAPNGQKPEGVPGLLGACHLVYKPNVEQVQQLLNTIRWNLEECIIIGKQIKQKKYAFFHLSISSPLCNVERTIWPTTRHYECKDFGKKGFKDHYLSAGADRRLYDNLTNVIDALNKMIYLRTTKQLNKFWATVLSEA